MVVLLLDFLKIISFKSQDFTAVDDVYFKVDFLYKQPFYQKWSSNYRTIIVENNLTIKNQDRLSRQILLVSEHLKSISQIYISQMSTESVLVVYP